MGDIVSATVSQPPDIWLTLKAQTGYFARGNILSRSAPAQVKLSTLAQGVAKDLGLVLDFQARDKNIANYTFTGAALQQIKKLADSGLVDAFADDDRLVVKDRGKALPARKRLLNKQSGMLGVPEVTENGVKVRMFIDPYTIIGTQLEIEGIMNPAANGTFTVFKTREAGANRSPQFYIDAEALRPGIGGTLL